MGAASSKVSETDDVDNPACMPTPSEKHVENPVFMPKQSEKHVENPAFIPTPAEKLKAYEAVIASLQRDLHVAHERAEVALNDLSVLDIEIEKLRHEKDDARRHINTATEAAKIAREKSLALQTEVEKLRAERVNNTRQMYPSHKASEIGSRAGTLSENGRRAGVVTLAEHETILKARNQKIEELEGICNELRKTAPNEKQFESKKGTVQLAEDQTIQSKEYSGAAEIAAKMMNGEKERCDECLKVLELYVKLLEENKSIFENFQGLHRTARKATDLIDQQAETIRKLEKLPKPHWVFEERRFWDHSDWKLRPVKPDNCGGS